MKYHYTPITMAKIKNGEHLECWQRYEGTRILIHCWRECKMMQLLWETVWQFYKKLNNSITIWSSDSIPRFIPKRIERRASDTCTPVFIEAIFTVAERWKQLNFSSTSEQINKICKSVNTYNGMLFSVIQCLEQLDFHI